MLRSSLRAMLATSIQIPGKELVSVPIGLFVNGAFREGTGREVVSVDTSNGTRIASFKGASVADVDEAVAAARAAFKTTWGVNVTGNERSRLMCKLADLLEASTETFALLEAHDSGRPVAWTRGDIHEVAECLRYYAGWANGKLVGQSLEGSSKEKQCLTRHEPIGVVAQIVPWNFPLLMLGWKISPALAAGCTIVFKPAENTSLTTMKLAELFNEAGFPAGVFNVLPGLGSETGVALAEHMDINKIAFTGSTQTGRLIAIAAAKSNLKRVSLELGGKSANIIFPSADLEQAIAWTALGVFENGGQSCTAGSRVLVHESILEEFTAGIKAAAEKILVGDPLKDETWQGPSVSKVQFDRVMEYIRIGKEEGTVLTGGERIGTEGYYIQPTIFHNVTNASRIAREEVFGPVLCIIPFKTEEEAIEIANDSDYGLAGALHSQSADQIGRVQNALEAGTVVRSLPLLAALTRKWINCYAFTANNAPFGGYKSSGWGRELGSYGLEAYTEVKAVHWNFGERISFPLPL